MDILASITTAAAALMGSVLAWASPVHSAIDGTWVQVDEPAVTMCFTRGKVQTKGVFGSDVTLPYKVVDSNEMREGERIMFTHYYKLRRGNGRIIDTSSTREFMLHTEEVSGRKVPILSEIAIELDGRGEVIFGEFLRPADAKALGPQFRSRAKVKRNDRPAPKMHAQ